MSFTEPLVGRIRDRIRDVPDFPKPGIIFKDLTPVFGDGALFASMVSELAARYRELGVDRVVGIEARGFLVAAPVASQIEKGLSLLRKPGKLPWETVSRSYALEYGEDRLEMHRDAVQPGERVVVMDDLLATGGTAKAAIELVEEHGGKVVEACFVVELGFLEGRGKLGAPCASIVRFD